MGVDIDTDTIKKASRKYVKDNLTFLVGTTSNIPVEDNSIDVVTSFETIEHYTEHEKILEEIKRVLKEDGVVNELGGEKTYNGGSLRDIRGFLSINRIVLLIGKAVIKLELMQHFNVNGYLKKMG